MSLFNVDVCRSPNVRQTDGIVTLTLDPQAMLAGNSRQNIILPSWSNNSNFTTSACIVGSDLLTGNSITSFTSTSGFRGQLSPWSLHPLVDRNRMLAPSITPYALMVEFVTVSLGVKITVAVTFVPLWKTHGCDSHGVISNLETVPSADPQSLNWTSLAREVVTKNAKATKNSMVIPPISHSGKHNTSAVQQAMGNACCRHLDYDFSVFESRSRVVCLGGVSSGKLSPDLLSRVVCLGGVSSGKLSPDLLSRVVCLGGVSSGQLSPDLLCLLIFRWL